MAKVVMIILAFDMRVWEMASTLAKSTSKLELLYNLSKDFLTGEFFHNEIEEKICRMVFYLGSDCCIFSLDGLSGGSFLSVVDSSFHIHICWQLHFFDSFRQFFIDFLNSFTSQFGQVLNIQIERVELCNCSDL